MTEKTEDLEKAKKLGRMAQRIRDQKNKETGEGA